MCIMATKLGNIGLLCLLIVSCSCAAVDPDSGPNEPSVTSATPNPDNNSTVPAPYAPPRDTSFPLQGNQCDQGMRLTNVPSISYAEANLLYMDIVNPALCSGKVTGWELCFRGNGFESTSFNLLMLTRDNSGYQVRMQHVVNIDPPSIGEEITNTVSCVFNKAKENVSISSGDYIGFVCNDDIQIGLTSISNEALGFLQVYNLTSNTQQWRQMIQGETQGINVDRIPSEELMPVGGDLIPQLRIIIDESNEIPVTQEPCNGLVTVWTPVFTAIVITTAVVIFVLFVMVCLMGCCICQLKYKCCNCLTRCLTCRRKRKVVHRITVDPITDQSMQYNDLYIPQDPSHIITDGRRYRADIQGNPAYASPQSNQYSPAESSIQSPLLSAADYNLRSAPSQDALSTATELSALEQYDSPSILTRCQPESTMSMVPETFSKPASSSSEMDLDTQAIFEDSRGFDHTYETIQSGKFVQ